MKDAIIKRLGKSNLVASLIGLVTAGFVLGFASKALALELSPSNVPTVSIAEIGKDSPVDVILDNLLVTDTLTPKVNPPKPKRKLPAPAPSEDWKKLYGQIVIDSARSNNLPPNLIMAVIAVESGFNAKARNGTSAGLMQIKVATARSFGLEAGGGFSKLLDPTTNIRIATNYLGAAYKLANGNICGTVSRYNRGLGSRALNHDYCAKVARIMRYDEFSIVD